MIRQTIHNVTSFKVSDIEENETNRNNKFYTREIIVEDKDGNYIELTMFSDDKDSLIPPQQLKRK